MSLGFVELSRRAEMLALRCSSLFLAGSEVALAEDLTDGFWHAHAPVSRRAVSASGLADAIEDRRDVHLKRMLVVRDGERLRPPVLEVLERRRFDARLRVLVLGSSAADGVRDWFLGRDAFCVLRGPSPELWGRWWATRTAGRWDLSSEEGWLVSERVGRRAVEFLGGSFGSALQAASALRTVWSGEGLVPWRLLEPFLSSLSGEGFVSALVFGSPRDALVRSGSVSDDDLARTLALVAWHLKVLWRLRLVDVAGPGGLSRLEQAGVALWQWNGLYRPVFARFTESRLRHRLALVEESRRAVRDGQRLCVLERLAFAW